MVASAGASIYRPGIGHVEGTAGQEYGSNILVQYRCSECCSEMEQLKSLLVANRGEIAARIIKTAKQASPFFEPLFRDTASDRMGALGSSIFAPSQSIQRQMQLLAMLLRPTNQFYYVAVMLRATLTGEQSQSGIMISLCGSPFHVP